MQSISSDFLEYIRGMTTFVTKTTMTLMDEHDLILKLQNSSHKAYEIIFKQYYAFLCAVAYEYVHDKYTSQSIVEDVMLTLWEKRKQISVTKSIKAYLMKAVRNQAIDFIRADQSFRSVDITDKQYQNCFVPDEDIFEQLVSRELEELIQQIIDGLPEECRKVFILSRYEGKSYQEISNELGVSVNTVKYHIKNALSIFRESLSGYLLSLLVLYFYLFGK